MRKTFLLAGILSVLVLGIAAEKSGKAISQVTNGKEVVATEKKAENTAEAVAMNFINLYVSLPEDINFERWFEAQPLTDNFKKAYKNQERAIEISEQILSGKKVSKADEEFARKYSVDYAPIFGAAILDLDENSVFSVKSYNQKTGIVTLKDEKTGIELPVKVIKVKG